VPVSINVEEYRRLACVNTFSYDAIYIAWAERRHQREFPRWAKSWQARSVCRRYGSKS